MKKIWLRFRAGFYPIIHISISLSDQLCCRIKFVSFWVCLNIRPTCVIFSNLSWTSAFQYTTTNYASCFIVVNINFPKYYFIGTVIDSWRCIILPFFPSELMWYFVSLILPCTGSSMTFRMKYLWVSNDFYGFILDRVNAKFLSNSIPFLSRLNSLISVTVEITGCLLPRVLYGMS